MTTASQWEQQVADVWSTAGEHPVEHVVDAIRALVAQRPAGDAAALYEQASAFDFAGREADAEPLYRRALSAGLDDARRPRAVIQLASTLRNLDRASEAVTLLREQLAHDTGEQGLRDAATAFLALALVDDGRPVDAAVEALRGLAHHLPEYGPAVSRYASELTRANVTP